MYRGQCEITVEVGTIPTLSVSPYMEPLLGHWLDRWFGITVGLLYRGS